MLKRNLDEKKAQMMAHKASVEAVRSELDKVKDEELAALRHQCEADLGVCSVYLFIMRH